MAVVRDLLVRLGVADGKQATKTMKAFDEAAKETKKSLQLLVGAATAVVGAVTAVTVATARDGDAAAKGADRIGIQVEAYQELAFAADRSGASINDLEMAFKRQASSAKDAQDGVGTATKAYNALNIKVEDTNGQLKTQDQLFTETVEALANVENKTLRAALAEDIFGRSASKLLPLIKGGAEGLNSLRKEASDLGLVLKEETAREAEAFTDSMTDLKAITTGLRNVLGAELLPIVTDIARGIRDWYLENKDLIRLQVREWAERITDAIADLQVAVITINEKMGGWKNTLKAISIAFQAMLGAFAAFRAGKTVIAIVGALQAVFALLTPPVLVVIGALASLVANLVLAYLAWEDLFTFLRGGDSVIGDVLAALKEGIVDVLTQLGLMGPMTELWEALRALLVELTPAADTLFAALGAGLSAGVGLLSLMLPLLQALGELWWWAFGEDSVAAIQLLGAALQFVFQGVLQNWVNTLEMITALIQGITALIQGSGGINNLLQGVGQGLLSGGNIGAGMALGDLGAVVAPNTSSAISNQSTSIQQGDIILQGISSDTNEISEVVRQLLDENTRQVAAAIASSGEG